MKRFHTLKAANRILRHSIMLALLFALCLGSLEFGFVPCVQAEPQEQQNTQENNKEENTLGMLRILYETMQSRQDKLRSLQLEYRLAEGEEQKKALEQRIADMEKELQDTLQDFSHMAAGEELDSFQTDVQQDFKLNEQIETILAPLLRELSELTQRPREIDNLRTSIDFKQEQLPVVKTVIERLDTLIENTENLGLRQRIMELRMQWAEIEAQMENELKIARYKLDKVLEERAPISTTLGRALENFFKTRGKNLILALLTFLAVYFLMRWFKNLLFKLPKLKKVEKRSFVLRLFNLSFVFLAVLLASASALATLYAAGDWLLLVIFFILFVSIAWSAKEGIMQYWEEFKLVLNVGGVREGERIVYRDLPWRVQRLNYYTRLENPELSGGALRVRLRDLIDYATRPCAQDEPWFPTKKGDWVLLEDGTYGRIVQQSVDMVRLWLFGDSFKTYQTASFLSQNPKVISTGFLVRSDFGVDYQHQDIATSEIPKAFENAIRQALDDAGKSELLKSLTVDFLQAGTSSLDIVIFASFDGKAADSYFAFGRIIQRACVETCTSQGWVIPFPQLTVHAQSTGSGGGE